MPAGQRKLLLRVTCDRAHIPRAINAEKSLMPRPRQRSHVDGVGAGPAECPRCRARRCTCGEDVVHQQNVFAIHGRWIAYRKRATHIQAAHARREACLALGCAQAHECAGRQREPPRRMTLRKKFQRLTRQCPRLIESALRMF